MADDYELASGKRRVNQYRANRRVFRWKDAQGQELAIAWQVSNDGAAFRYELQQPVPGTTFQVAGGPYTVPVSINNASRVSVMTLTITYNPNVLRVRNVQDGTFMRQGGVATTFTPQIDAAAGRVDIAITRTGDQVGASGAGLLAALLFDAVAPGSAIISANGVASTPEGGAVTLQFSPVTVTVR